MMTREQQAIKAQVALARYTEHSKVSSEREVEITYHLAQVLYNVVLDTHFLRKQQNQKGQLVLLESSTKQIYRR